MTTAPPDNRSTKPDIAYRQMLAVAALIAALTLMRLIYAHALDLRTDEAYYWTWSKESALSFLDHPPMIAWFIRFGTAIFGDTSLGVRFAGILAMLVTQLLLADIVRRVTHDVRAMVFAVLMPEAALYYGLLMAKVSPDTAMIPFAVAMLWALVRLDQSGNPRWWLAAGLFAGLALLSKFTAVMLVPAVVAFALVPDWRRWLFSPYPWAAAVIAVIVFSPVLIWNAQHDWASFRFQFVRAVATHEVSFRTVGEFIGLQFGLVGFVMLPVVLSGVTLTAWRGYRRREPVAILLSTAVLIPFLYFCWKSLTLRVGDTWPMFLWPAGFAAAAINLAVLPREKIWPKWMIQSSFWWARVAVISGIAFVVGVFLYYVAAPWNLIGRTDPVGGEAGYEAVAARARDQLKRTGATWIATTDYRTYAMLRWHFNGGVPVVQINERGRFQGFRDPGMDWIRDHPGLYVAREPDDRLPLWDLTTATRQPLARVERSWRGVVMDTYALEKLTGWTPELSPPPGSPLFQWRVLAENGPTLRVAAVASK